MGALKQLEQLTLLKEMLEAYLGEAPTAPAESATTTFGVAEPAEPPLLPWYCWLLAALHTHTSGAAEPRGSLSKTVPSSRWP